MAYRLLDEGLLQPEELFDDPQVRSRRRGWWARVLAWLRGGAERS